MATNHSTVDVFRQELATGELGGTPALSRADDSSLKTSFPGSPIIGPSATLTPEERRAEFQKLALDGEVINGFCFSSFNRDFYENDPPAYEDVKTGPGGLPGSPFTPNVVSPGADNGVDPTKMGDPPAYMYDGKDPLLIKTTKASRPPFNGSMTDVDPKATSWAIDQTKVETLGEYLGRSPGRVDDWGSVSGE